MKIIITSGGTREPIDPVRYIGNYSTGKMGAALAKAFKGKGNEVIVIAAHSEVEYLATKVIRVETAADMLKAVTDNLPCDIYIGAAAVADKRPKAYSKSKIKKDALESVLLTVDADILKTVASHKKRPNIVIGFAAESENHVKNARIKLTKKSCDLMVVNDITALGNDENEVWVISSNMETKLPKASKDKIAANIVKIIGDIW
jgi:phosphopantothenoylcysteine decarboxylase/phosphopantothenate--cysteine ligase